MADPFAAALAVLHRAAGSVAADYTILATGDVLVGIGVIRSQGSEVSGARSARTITDPNHFDVQKSDVAMPAKGDTLTIGSETFRINGPAILDEEGLTWTCPAEPA